MLARALLLALVILGSAISPARAGAGCKLGRIAELPVNMTGLRPMVAAKINGNDVVFMADSGAFYSLISPAAAAEFKLRTYPAPHNLRIQGIGGSVQASVATVKEFTLTGVPLHNLEFVVGGSDVGSGAVGLLGQNVLRIADVEYDLANGVIRLMRTENCNKMVLAYWLQPGQPYSMMDIDWATPLYPHTTGTAYINGTKIRVMFDTGAATSLLTLRAAERAGIKPDTAGVDPAGFSSGIGRTVVKTWIATFPSFKIGDEEVKNARLRFGDSSLTGADMLIGADFFLSHRIYVASSQRKLYFSYNGGPVFNLTSRTPVEEANAAVPESSDAPAKEGPQDEPKEESRQATAEQPADAAGFSRRGSAFTARHDYEHAIADLTRACELEPTEARYFYERGVAYLSNKQPALALADFDQTLKLNPNDLSALMARAELRLAGRDHSAAIADLDAVNRLAPKEVDLRLLLGHFYERVEMFAPAIAQFDLWIAAHKDDSRMVNGLGSRCWSRMLLGVELDKALDDCNAAVRLQPNNPQLLITRGFVRLRLGKYDPSIADFSASLSQQPRNAVSLYGRGLAESKKGLATAAQGDIAAATALRPDIATEFTSHGLEPQQAFSR